MDNSINIPAKTRFAYPDNVRSFLCPVFSFPARKIKPAGTLYLLRLFKLGFNQTIGLYIRSRKLAASIDDLLNTNLNVLDIALDYGFEYEQSYIRSFKREYGITPGSLCKTGKILPITPPLSLFDSQKCHNLKIPP